MSIALAIKSEGQRLIREQTPDLEQYFPFHHNFHFQAHWEAEWFVLRVIFIPALAMMVGPRMEATDAALVVERIGAIEELSPEGVISALGKDWFDVDRFTYVGPYAGSSVSWKHISDNLLSWLNRVALPRVLGLNERRVQRAVPAAPNYDVIRLSEALWVLECEETSRQGTAFALEGVGLVTCEHVLGTATYAFRHNQLEKKYPIRIIRRHAVVDLAIIEFDAPSVSSLHQGDLTTLTQMDHLLVLGHPNYRIGDSPVVTPGLVVGFRQHSGIRRLLTNASIVAGCSGGPVVDRHGRVVGVAVTGADAFDEVRSTEDISVIPIDALALIDC